MIVGWSGWEGNFKVQGTRVEVQGGEPVSLAEEHGLALVEGVGGALEAEEESCGEIRVDGSGREGLVHARDGAEDGTASGERAEVGGTLAAARDAGRVLLAAEALLGAAMVVAEGGAGDGDGAAGLEVGMKVGAESGGRLGGHSSLSSLPPGWGWGSKLASFSHLTDFRDK
jgi:hypothetical protein